MHRVLVSYKKKSQEGMVFDNTMWYACNLFMRIDGKSSHHTHIHIHTHTHTHTHNGNDSEVVDLLISLM